MIKKFNITIIIFLLCATQIYADNEINSLLEYATDLTLDEINALRPLFKQLQDQYDYILNQTPSAKHDEEPQLTDDYENMNNEFENYFEEFVQNHSAIKSNNKMDKYNITLPTVTELLGVTSLNPTNEELDERADIESLLEDALIGAQIQIDEIVRRSLHLEAEFIKINKPKLVAYIYKALIRLYRVAGRVGRTAYCTYSHIPQLNESLHNIYDGIDCYNYTKRLVLQVEQETVRTVSTIRRNVFSLAGIYKKIAGKKTLLGKLSTVILNIMKIVRDINETSQAGTVAIDKLQNELPVAVNKSLSCGRNFIDGVPQMTEVVSSLTYCITFVDNDVIDYEFLKPENERDFKN